jgi:hypothetical protein
MNGMPNTSEEKSSSEAVTDDYRDQIRKMCRKADMLCTAHGVERDTYRRRATWADALLMAVSAYIVAMAFVDPELSHVLVPAHWNPIIVIGTLSLGTFILSILQLVLNWKGRADSHGRSYSMYAEVKSTCIDALTGNERISRESYNNIRSRYSMATDVGTHIEDSRFLKLKQWHLKKIELSKLLDKRPGTWLLLLRLHLWWRDTFHNGDEGKAE